MEDDTMTVEKYLTLHSVCSSAEVSFLHNDENKLFAITIKDDDGYTNMITLDKEAIQVMIDVTNGVLKKVKE